MSSSPDYIPIFKLAISLIAVVIFFASGAAYAVLEFIFGAVALIVAAPIIFAVLAAVSRY